MTSGLHSRESEATLQPGRAETISWTSDQPTENRSQFQLDQSERPNFEEFDKIGNGVDSKNKHHSRPFSMVSLEQSYMPSSQSRKSETNSSRDQAANGNSDEDSLRRQKTEARAASEGGPTGESKGDEEKGNAGPPKPVGFWDKSLNKTRLLVFRRWLFMSSFCIPSSTMHMTNLSSCTFIGVHPRHSLSILGCSIQSRRQSEFNHCVCC